jgi:hypothetical protein
MSTAKNKLLSNPWFIGTGTSILGVIVLKIIDSFAHTNILISIWDAIKWIANIIVDFLQIKYQVSLWFLIVLPILVLGLIVLIILIISSKEGKKNPQGFSFLDYKEDQFGEVLYRWDYVKDFSDKYVVNRLNWFCPKCRCAIVDQRCPICHSSFYDQIKSHEEVIALISHQIEFKSKIDK